MSIDSAWASIEKRHRSREAEHQHRDEFQVVRAGENLAEELTCRAFRCPETDLRIRMVGQKPTNKFPLSGSAVYSYLSMVATNLLAMLPRENQRWRYLICAIFSINTCTASCGVSTT